MPSLTKKQKEILDFVKGYIQSNGVSPTYEEMARHTKKSFSTIYEHVEGLISKGVLKKANNGARGIEVVTNDELIEIPMKGFIAAGSPISVLEEYETITIPKNVLARSGEHFALRVKGDSMIQEGIFDGDTVVIRKQSTAENGETVVALINDNEATIKKIYKIKEGFRLQPANPSIKPFIVRQMIVQGKVVSVMRTYESRRNLQQALNMTLFIEELRELISNSQIEIQTKFHSVNEFEIWKATESSPDKEKFLLETVYTFFNELILLWVCKDKQLIDFEIIEDVQQLSILKNKAQKIYSHIFANNIFDWYEPTSLLLQRITNSFNKYDFSQIDRDILGKLYERFITKEERKKLGQFYTPESVVDYILDQTEYTKDIINKKIIDISCGSGGFITRATGRLIDRLKKEHRSSKMIIETVSLNIYGLDINPFACYLAETNVLIQLIDLIVEVKQENQNYTVPKIKIFQTNTIETPSLLSRDEEEIKQIKNTTGEYNKGFDFVVGNPPYLEAKKMDQVTKRLCAETCPEVASGAFDLFVCFIDKGLKLLKKGGQFGYIIPNKFLIANYAKKMREELLGKYSIKEIIDVSEMEVFENVSVYPVIIVIEKSIPEDNIILTAEKIKTKEDLAGHNFVKSSIKQDTYKRDDLVFFILPNDEKQNTLLTKLLSDKFKTLDNYLTLKWTISFHASGLREKFLFPEKPDSKWAKKLIGGKSFAGNDDINRYNLKWGGWWIDYNEEIAKKHKNPLPPTSLFEQEKIIICQNSLRLRATYDDQGYFCKDTFFVGSVSDSKKKDYSLKFFLALMNSKLLHYYYANIYNGTHIAGGYLHYLIGYLYSLPIAEPTKKQQSDIVALVEEILTCRNEVQFEKIDSAIDTAIYKLYGLSKEEVNIVKQTI